MTSSKEDIHADVAPVIVIGPVLPFRGGIAQHTTMLARAVKIEANVHVFSFKRLYPKWLYPGSSDRDSDLRDHHEAGVDYSLDSLNPMTWHRCAKQVVGMQPAFALFPWWTFFLGPCFAYISAYLRKENVEVIFFCHNVSDHEDKTWKRLIAKWVLGTGSRFVVHTKLDRQNLIALHPSAEVVVHPHPIYEHFPEPRHLLPRRAKLELLFYGFVRPYKGLKVLLRALSQLRDMPVFLTVAGEFWDGYASVVAEVETLGITNQIEIRPGYHSDADTAELFERADVVVLPYLSATGSGVIPLAYHYRRPVIATRVGGLPDVVVDRETGWLVDSGDALALAQTIRDIPNPVEPKMRRAIEEMSQSLSWSSLAHVILHEFRSAGARQNQSQKAGPV
ncbi:MAG: glycosyltransferase family 4 protein [Pseudomonadota bacterium]